MPDEQDRAEALDEDKFDEDPAVDGDGAGGGIDLIDQTADADPGTADLGAEEIDALESGDDLDGVRGESDPFLDRAHDEVPAPEVAAVHLTDEP